VVLHQDIVEHENILKNNDPFKIGANIFIVEILLDFLFYLVIAHFLDYVGGMLQYHLGIEVAVVSYLDSQSYQHQKSQNIKQDLDKSLELHPYTKFLDIAQCYDH